jgi:hypothetical protein
MNRATIPTYALSLMPTAIAAAGTSVTIVLQDQVQHLQLHVLKSSQDSASLYDSSSITIGTITSDPPGCTCADYLQDNGKDMSCNACCMCSRTVIVFEAVFSDLTAVARPAIYGEFTYASREAIDVGQLELQSINDKCVPLLWQGLKKASPGARRGCLSVKISLEQPNSRSLSRTIFSSRKGWGFAAMRSG